MKWKRDTHRLRSFSMVTLAPGYTYALAMIFLRGMLSPSVPPGMLKSDATAVVVAGWV